MSKFVLLAITSLLILFAGCEYLPVSSAPGTTVNPVTETAEPSLTPTPVVFPDGPAYTPDAAAFIPSDDQAEIFQYALDLINSDRAAAGLSPVVLGTNAAAQIHAQDMFDYYYIAHWGTDGLKPYMRYTLEGGLNYEMENSAYSGWYDTSIDPDTYADIDVKQQIYDLEYAMMNDDGPTWGHHDNILNSLHTKVNLGIVYDNKRVALVQQFEGDYVEFYQPPVINGTTLSLTGRLLEGTLQNVQICFDEYPEAINATALVNGPYHSYSLGDRIAYLVPPPPPGQYYSNLGTGAVVSDQWDTSDSGQFMISADIAEALSRGRGVYTIVISAEMNGKQVQLTNYSIFIK